MVDTRKVLKIKQWFIDKIAEEASNYNYYFNYFKRTELGTAYVEDECVFVVADEVLNESEKAIKVRLATGDVVGSYKGWVAWVPKSVICE